MKYPSSNYNSYTDAQSVDSENYLHSQDMMNKS